MLWNSHIFKPISVFITFAPNFVTYHLNSTPFCILSHNSPIYHHFSYRNFFILIFNILAYYNCSHNSNFFFFFNRLYITYFNCFYNTIYDIFKVASMSRIFFCPIYCKLWWWTRHIYHVGTCIPWFWLYPRNHTSVIT